MTEGVFKIMVSRKRSAICTFVLAMFVSSLAVMFDAYTVSAAEPAKASGWLQIPQPPKGKGDKCVADTEFMRRNHMKMLLHQRDRTVHEGIRTKRFSLKECIDCHAVKGADNKPVTIKSPKHFCRSCHDYAAVRVDCFQCHASRPDPNAPGKAALLPGAGAPPNDGKSYHRAGNAASSDKSQDQARAEKLERNKEAAALANYVRSTQ